MWKLICAMLGHRPLRKLMWNDSMSYRAPCRRCGTSLIRKFGCWVPFESDKHANTGREPHPHFDC